MTTNVAAVPAPVQRCRWGHPYNAINTRVRAGKKECRVCAAIRERARVLRNKQQRLGEVRTMAVNEEPLSDLELEGLEYHCTSSGTNTPPLVRHSVIRLIAEVRMLRPLVPCYDGHDFAIRTVVGATNILIHKCSRCPAVEIP